MTGSALKMTGFYFFLKAFGAVPPARFAAMFFRFEAFEIWVAVTGVFFEIRFEGRQYSLPGPSWPHGFPVLTSIHFSFPHLLRFAPALVFLTAPWLFLHLATAWAALALHFP